MIFVTIGTQGPFDRLIRAVDEWAGASRRSDVFAQVGRGAWRPRHLESVETLPAEEFDTRLKAADLVVSHAGTGTIIKALELGKPIVVVPRRSDRAEQRNDHQLATARRFGGMGLVDVAFDVPDLIGHLDRLDAFAERPPVATSPSPALLKAIGSVLRAARVDGRSPHVMAVASGGGHWSELVKLTEHLAPRRVTYVTVDRELQRDVQGAPLLTFTDANRQTPARMLRLALESLVLVVRVRPDVVISTGAAPGYIAIVAARILGAKAIWLDSLANVDELSLSGRLAGRWAHLWLTQWPHLAAPKGPRFAGSVLGAAVLDATEREV